MARNKKRIDPYAGMTARPCLLCEHPYIVPCDGMDAECANRRHVERIQAGETTARRPAKRRVAKPKTRARTGT